MNIKEQRMKLWCDVYLHYKKTGNTIPHVKANEALKDFDNRFKEEETNIPEPPEPPKAPEGRNIGSNENCKFDYIKEYR